MNTGLYRGVAALSVAQKSMDSIAANLASVSTPGYKRRATANHGFHVGRFGSSEVHVASIQRNDFSQGAIETTGNPLDLAIQGDGFFELEGDDGPVFTRDGEFRLLDDGTMVSPEGFAVTWDPRVAQLDPGGEEILVSNEGVVTQGGRTAGTLKLVAFADNQALRHTSDGYLVADPNLDRTVAVVEVRQKSLERANIDAVEELVAMITVQRSHQLAASLISQIDQSYRRLTAAR